MKHFQQAVWKNNTRQYPVYIKFQYEHILKVWCCNSNLPLPGQVRFFSFPFVHPFWTHDWKRIYILTPWSYFTEFSSALQFEQTSQSSALKRWMHFLWLQVFFSLLFSTGWNKRYVAVNSISFIYWKNPGLFLSAEVMHYWWIQLH